MAAKKKKAAKPAKAAKSARAAKPAKPARKAATAATSPAAGLKPRKQPETLRIRAVSPGYTVNDIHKSLDFYIRILGFVIKERWERGGKLMGADIQAGTTSFMLGQDDWHKGRDRRKGEGVRMYCTTAQNIDALAEAVKARGGTLDHEPEDQPWGTRDFGITDPDGFKITIST